MTDPIRQLVLDELPHVEELSEDDDLLAPGMLDSLAIIRVVAALEDLASITVEQEEIEPTHFRSLRTIRALVERKRGGGA